MDDTNTDLQIKKELPRGLMVSSFLAIIFVLALLPFIAWLLEYKDTISAPLTITTKITPVDVYAKTTGELELLVKNETLVEKGTPLAMIKNTAAYKDVQVLKTKLNQPDKTDLLIAKDLCSANKLAIGDLKPALVEVIKAVEAHQTFLKTDQHQQLIKSRLAQIEHYQSRQAILNEKATYLEENKAIAAKIAADNQEMLAKEVIEGRLVAEDNQDQIASAIAHLNNKTDINDLSIEIETLNQENIAIKSQFANQELTYLHAISDALQLLDKDISVWELAYLLKANISGVCIHKGYLNDYRFVKEEEKVFSIIPKETTQYFALLQLPMEGAGKVKKEQEVYVKLNNYPFMEFGVLKGEVSDISALPFDSHYNVQVNFPNGFVSTYGDTLLTQPLMHGIGEVIVERKSLYSRIADQVKSVRLNR